MSILARFFGREAKRTQRVVTRTSGRVGTSSGGVARKSSAVPPVTTSETGAPMSPMNPLNPLSPLYVGNTIDGSGTQTTSRDEACAADGGNEGDSGSQTNDAAHACEPTASVQESPVYEAPAYEAPSAPAYESSSNDSSSYSSDSYSSDSGGGYSGD